MSAESETLTPLTRTDGRIIKDRAIVVDAWVHVADDASLPAEGDIIVGRDRWVAERDALNARSGEVGVRYLSTEDPIVDAADLAAVALIALDFPKFTDGRAYSYAQVLRTRHGYRGELRATGDVLRDQLRYMWRCGFDAFEVRADKSIEDALHAFDEFTVDYQHSPPNNAARSA
ncbi:MAG: hypothetical protein ACI9U2_002610 [Bradymonadia bacterium]|jgi:uncharacterized protein (DUF934 family)